MITESQLKNDDMSFAVAQLRIARAKSMRDHFKEEQQLILKRVEHATNLLLGISAMFALSWVYLYIYTKTAFVSFETFIIISVVAISVILLSNIYRIYKSAKIYNSFRQQLPYEERWLRIRV